MDRVHNFGAGPAVLPEPVLAEAARGIVEIGGSGMSILEVSHRGGVYEALHQDTQARLLRILGLDASEHAVLFLGGGAHLQFAMLPMNMLPAGATADYVDTGAWSRRAIAEAQVLGRVNVVASSAAAGYGELPDVREWTPGAAYAHITTNNTIEGTEWPGLPETGDVPLVADASSDFLSRRLDNRKLALVYAGAQKNAGPAGITIVVARRTFLDGARQDIPATLAYATHVRENSLYNTPPVFGVYVVGLVLGWVEAEGGLEALEIRNRRKAGLVYDALDAYPDVYEPTVTVPAHRSLMNVTFRLRDRDREPAFLSGAEKRCMVGLKGHRSVGGFRASLYNALPERSAEALANYLRAFASGQAVRS